MTIARHDAMAELWQDAVAVVEALAPDDWQRPVPWCPDWSVADLVSHLGGLQSVMNGDPHPPPAATSATTTDNPFDQTIAGTVAARRNWEPQRRVEELRNAAARHVEQLAAVTDWLAEADGPVGRTTHDGLFRARAFDVWVHLGDLREAVGIAPDLDDASQGATAAHLYVLGLVPWLFAKRAGAGDGATMRVALGPPVDHDSVLEVVQRRATWNPAADAGDCAVTGKPAALTLLVSGRGTPQRWRDAGALSWSGPLGQEFVDRARLF